jgi:hypothetical protein
MNFPASFVQNREHFIALTLPKLDIAQNCRPDSISSHVRNMNELTR